MKRALILVSALLLGCGASPMSARAPAPAQVPIIVAAVPAEGRLTLDVLELI